MRLAVEERTILVRRWNRSDPAGQAVYERMQSIGARAGIADCQPHRLRDTFAVRKLLAGMQLEDVSRLLGHSSVKVTEAYCAKMGGFAEASPGAALC